MTRQQRAAMFANLRLRKQQGMQRGRKRIEKTNPAVLGGVAGVSMLGAVHPRVTHGHWTGPAVHWAKTVSRPVEEASKLGIGSKLAWTARSAKIYGKDLLKAYPQLRYYPAIPAAAMYAASRSGKKPKSRKESLVRAATTGGVGPRLVSVSLANSTMSVPCAWRLYLPEQWRRDRRRREACAVPTEIRFQPKWQIALEEIDRLRRMIFRGRRSWQTPAMGSSRSSARE